MTRKKQLIELVKEHIKEFGKSKPQYHYNFTHYNLMVLENEDCFGKSVVYICYNKVFVRYKYRFPKVFDIDRQWAKEEIENLCVTLGIQF